jgi:hypothetical protein
LNYEFRMHDPRVGRFFAIDPLFRKYPYNSTYAFSENRVIDKVELEGLEQATTTFTYESIKGKSKYKVVDADFIVDNTKKRSEIIFMIIDDHKYKANSYETTNGKDDKYRSNGDFTGVVNLTSKDLSAILGYADFVFEIFAETDSKEETVLKESNAGPLKTNTKLLDFKNSLYDLLGVDKDKLIGIDGVVYNANEVGNYLWGLVLEDAGVIVDANTIAELGTKGRSDEPHEQKAIAAGRKKANTLKVDKKEREITFDTYDYDYKLHKEKGGSRDNYVPSDDLGLRKKAIETTK